jgi:hypothetical protein
MFFTNPEYYFFLFKLLLVFFAGGLVVAGAIQKFFNKADYVDKSLVILLGIGFSPFLIALLVYYCLLIIPNQADALYLAITYGCFVAIGLITRKEIAGLLIGVKSTLAFFFKTKKILFLGAILMSMCFIFGWSFYLSSKHLTEHDVLEYAVQGKVFYESKLIGYSAHRYDPISGFYYVGLHGFSFPLQATNERMLNAIFGFQGDLLFKSFNSLYGILILAGLFIYSLKRNGFIFAASLGLSLTLSYGFFETIMKYHIDNFRIFYFMASIFLITVYLKKTDLRILVLTSIFLAAQANSHSLGCMLAILELLILFLLVNKSLLIKVKEFGIAAIVFLIFGALHYVLDVLIGTGWIFQEVKFY